MKIYYCLDCYKKVSDYRVKRCRSCAAKDIMKKRNLKGINNPMFGRLGVKNPNYKDGRCLIKHLCKDCGKEISFTSYYGLGRCKSCSKKGKLNNEFINGSSYEKYPSEFNDNLKESVRKRDDYICQNCGMTEEEHLIVYGRVIHVHHIDYNKKNNIKNNLITLCQGCNLRANCNRNYWQEFYTKKLNCGIINE